MWEKIDVPPVPTPIHAVSFPDELDYGVVWTDDALFRVRLSNRPHVSRLMSVERAKERFHAESGSVEVMNTVRPIRLTMHGRCADLGTFQDSRISDTHAHGDHVVIDAVRKEVRVVDVTGQDVLTIPRFRVDSPLAVAGFYCAYRPGYRDYFIACDGESFHAFRYRTNRKGVATKHEAYAGQTRDSLLRACFDHPDDDTPRLIFADWLDEHGDPDRAQFIRIQCRLAARRRTGFVPSDDPDAAEEASLIAIHGERWSAELPRLTGVHHSDRNFYRGFLVPEMISPVKSSTNACRMTLARHHPLDALGYMHYRVPRETGPFWAWDAFPRVRYLFLNGGFDTTILSIARLLRTPSFTGVRHLHMSGWQLAPIATALVEGPVGRSVESLTYHECMFEGNVADALAPLAEGKRLPNLASITFIGSFNEGIERTSVVRRLAKTYGSVYRITDDRKWKRVTPDR